MAFSPVFDRLSRSPMTSAPGYFHLHLISDSTGETLITVARAAAAQYAKIMPVVIKGLSDTDIAAVSSYIEGLHAAATGDTAAK